MVIFIESVHLLENEYSGSMIQFWLPRVLPNRIKFVFTVKKESNAYNYLKNQKSTMIDFTNCEKELRYFRIQKYFSKSEAREE